MKRILISLMAVFFVMSLVSVGFAADKKADKKAPAAAAEEVKAKGKVKSVDEAKGELVFCAAGTKEDVTIKADKDMLKGVKANSMVNIVYEKGAAGNTAKKITKDRGAKVPVGC